MQHAKIKKEKKDQKGDLTIPYGHVLLSKPLGFLHERTLLFGRERSPFGTCSREMGEGATTKEVFSDEDTGDNRTSQRTAFKPLNSCVFSIVDNTKFVVSFSFFSSPCEQMNTV